MKLKENITTQLVYESLKRDLSSHIRVRHIKIFDQIDIKKNMFVAIRLKVHPNEITLGSYVPGLFINGIIGHLISHNARETFQQQIAQYLLKNFYEE